MGALAEVIDISRERRKRKGACPCGGVIRFHRSTQFNSIMLFCEGCYTNGPVAKPNDNYDEALRLWAKMVKGST